MNARDRFLAVIALTITAIVVRRVSPLGAIITALILLLGIVLMAARIGRM